MDINGYTTACCRIRTTNFTQYSHDVGLFLPYKIHHRTAYDIDESKVSNSNRYKHKINRSTKTYATGFKGIGNKYQNIGEFYN